MPEQSSLQGDCASQDADHVAEGGAARGDEGSGFAATCIVVSPAKAGDPRQPFRLLNLDSCFRNTAVRDFMAD